jgi:hypothetical protein
MSTHVLPPLAVNSKSEQKVNSLPLLEFEPVIFRMLAHLSDHSDNSHSHVLQVLLWTCCTHTHTYSLSISRQTKGGNLLRFLVLQSLQSLISLLLVTKEACVFRLVLNALGFNNLMQPLISLPICCTRSGGRQLTLRRTCTWKGSLLLEGGDTNVLAGKSYFDSFFFLFFLNY